MKTEIYESGSFLKSVNLLKDLGKDVNKLGRFLKSQIYELG